MCSKCAISILGSIVSMLAGRTYTTTQWARKSLVWQWTRHLYELLNSTGKWLRARFGFANHLAAIACFISSKKWVQREYASKARLLKAFFLTHSPVRHKSLWLKSFLSLRRTSFFGSPRCSLCIASRITSTSIVSILVSTIKNAAFESETIRNIKTKSST